MSSVLLYHHLGLGDHIMCHGIVREYCKKYNRVGIFSKSHNYPSVSFMYRDLSNLTIIKGDDGYAKKFIFLNRLKFGRYRYDSIKIIGHEYLDRASNIPLEQQFYQFAGVDFAKKWENFFVKRDTAREEALFKRVPLSKFKDYAFIHEDRDRGFKINRAYINENYAVFAPDKKLTDNIFDYCAIIEKAKEIHVIDSSFMFLVDCLPYENPVQKLYIHRYARENEKWLLPVLKKSWNIITA